MASELRARFLSYMAVRRLASKTQEAYIAAVSGLADYYNKPPDKLSNEQIQEYLRYLIKDRKLAWSTCNVYFSGLHCFYKNVLLWEKTRFSIPRRPRIRTLPQLLSKDEVKRLLSAPDNLKHRALLMCVYCSGLRVSEVVKLKPHHIESSPERMMIRVEGGKGRKDRYTILVPELLDMLRQYWREYQPGPWLFFGRDRNKPMTDSTAQRIYYLAKKKADVKNGRGIHTLRHCFATHLLYQGIDIYTIKRLLGHSSISTTFKYLHVTPESIHNVKSPLDMHLTEEEG